MGVYLADSLKALTQQRRGSGIRYQVTGITTVPNNWVQFLQETNNKKELFAFLFEIVMQAVQSDGELYVTDEENLLSYPVATDVETLSTCQHEEADTRIIIHAFDATSKGSKNIIKGHMILMLLYLPWHILIIGLISYLLLLVKGKNFHYIPAHDIVVSIGIAKSESLLVFHEFTGCDTASSFCGKGRKSA